MSKIAPKVAVPIPPNVKPPSVRAKSPAPSTKVTATIIKLPFWLKSTRFCTQILAPATAGKKGGQHSGGNFKNDPQRASEAGKKGGKSSHGKSDN